MNDQMSFSGQSVWVTGAGQGIGRAVAEGFARLGAQVVGFDRAFSEGDYGFTTYLLDVGDAGAVRHACGELLGGQQRVDVFASVAGATVSVELLPLLSKKVASSVETVALMRWAETVSSLIGLRSPERGSENSKSSWPSSPPSSKTLLVPRERCVSSISVGSMRSLAKDW